MLVRYFRRPSRIEQLRSNTGGYLLEGFAKELSESRYQWDSTLHSRRAGRESNSRMASISTTSLAGLPMER
jgi:hypothetical protein